MSNVTSGERTLRWKKAPPAPDRERHNVSRWFAVATSLFAAAAVLPFIGAVVGLTAFFVAPLAPFYVWAMWPSFGHEWRVEHKGGADMEEPGWFESKPSERPAAMPDQRQAA